jgi:hypothetical protein
MENSNINLKHTFLTIWLTLGTIAICILYAQWQGYCHFEHHEQPQAVAKYTPTSVKLARSVFAPYDDQ